MNFKTSLIQSLGLGAGGGAAAYALAWGLFSTHPELGMEPKSAWMVAAWAGPLVFIGSAIYFAVRSSERR